jgi:putative hydrolase of the HAD superfamily
MVARFDAVVFDAGGVLVVPTPEVFGPLVAEFGGDASPASILRAHYAGMREMDAHSTATQTWVLYDRGFLDAVGIPPHRRDAADAAMRATMTSDIDLWRWPIPGVVAALWALAEAGVPLAVVSNAEGQIEETLRREGVCQVGAGAGVPVAIVVDSHVVGVAKPDPRIFRPAIEKLGTDPARTAYVGDSIAKDVIGARNAGLHPLHLDPYDDHPDATHERIRSLRDLF